MSALERGARRIGMERGERHWYDPEGDNIYFHAPEEAEALRHYLLTQALRVQVEYGMRTSPMTNSWSEVVGWAASSLEGHASVTADELPAAIIALAQRIEGGTNVQG